MNPKFCKDCKWSVEETNATWNLKCFNPYVNADDPWALSYNGHMAGTSCRTERERKWFAVCGIKGKQFKEKQIKNTPDGSAKTLRDAIDKWNEECQ